MKLPSQNVSLPLRRSIALLLAVLALHPHAHGAAYAWDGDLLTPDAQDGGGTWDTVTANWVTGGINIPWGNGNDAIFGAGVDGSYLVSIALNPSATSLVFNNSGYTLSAASAQTITANNAVGALVIAAGKTATIGSNVTVTTPIANQTTTMTGGGTLILENGGALRNGGTVNSNRLDINATTVEVRTGGSLLTSPIVGQANGNAIFVNGTVNVLGGTINSVGTLGLGQSSAVGTAAGRLTIDSGTVLATSTNGIRFGGTGATTPGGTVNLNGGTLTAAIIFRGSVNVTDAIMNLNGGTLQPSVSSATFMQGLTRANVRDGGAIIDTNGRSITIAQALEHSNIGGDNATDGGLIKNGAGLLILNGVNTYNGGTTINGGALQFGAGAVPGGSIVINAGGAMTAGGAFATVNDLLSSGLITAGSTGSIGLTTDSFEDINFSAYPNLKFGASVNSMYFGTLTPAGNTYRLGGGGATLTLSNTDALTGARDVIIGGAGSTGTVVLSSTNNYTGTTTINSGALQLDTPSYPGGTITINSPGALNVASAADWLGSGRITPASNGVIALTTDSFESIDLTGFANLSLGAATNASLSATLTPAGTTYRLGGGGGTLTLFSENTLTGANEVIIDAGGSTGVVVIAGANDYTGTTTINAGATLQIGNGGSDGSIASSSAIVNSGTLVFNPGLVQEFGQSISGGGTLTKQGGGTLILSGANSHTGATVLAGGILQLAHADALGSSVLSVTNNNTQLQLAGGITVTDPIRIFGSGLNLGGILASVGGENTLTDFGLSGNGGTRISVSAGSTLNLPNPITLAVGVTAQNFRVIGAGTVFLGGDNSGVIAPANLFLLGLGTEAGPTVKVGHELAFGLGILDFQPLANSTVQSNDATARTIANELRFSDVSLNQATFGAPGTGKLLFTGAATLLGSLEVTIANAETTFSGPINGTGFGITKLGDGLLTLSGAQNYDTLTTQSGTTNLDAALGSGASTLNANAATNISTNQTLAALNIGDGAVVTLAESAPAPAAGAVVHAVPEPATFVTLLGGIATLLGFRNRRRARATA